MIIKTNIYPDEEEMEEFGFRLQIDVDSPFERQRFVLQSYFRAVLRTVFPDEQYRLDIMLRPRQVKSFGDLQRSPEG